MKGAEERDFMFGRIFGYVALIRAGRLTTLNELNDVIDRFEALYKKKHWVQELIIEAFLLLLSTIQNKDIKITILQRIVKHCQGELNELNENQLMLRIGLQLMAQSDSVVKAELLSLVPKDKQFSFDKIDEVVTLALIPSTHKFPKLHRLWDFLIGMIIQLGDERDTKPSR